MRIKGAIRLHTDRRVGKSKMSGSIVQEALFYVVKLRAQRIWNQITGRGNKTAAKN